MSNYTNPYGGEDSGSLPISDLERGPAAKFNDIGDEIAGVISSVNRTPQTDIESGEILTWNDGSPRMQTVIGLDLPDGTSSTLYVKGGTFTVAQGTGQSMESAIVAAVKAAGGDAIRRGDSLAIGRTGTGKPTRKGFTAPRLFTAQYKLAEPVGSSVPVDDLFS